jgi:molybdate transport system substrate-binding protein
MLRRSVLLLAASLVCATAPAADRALTVFAAASLTDVLEEIGTRYTASTGNPVRLSFAASSVLARQIESGAPADVFVSADQQWMDYLQQRNLIEPATRRNVVTNTLVLVAPASSTLTIRIAPGFGLARALGERGRLAIADPETVPAGRYAKASLTALGVWDSVQTRVVPSDNVRTALNFVARGETPLGIVYATDARAESAVRVIGTFPAGTHEPITYPAATLKNASREAGEFVNYRQDDAARAAFDRAGFALP